jgi:hypothetical protein
MEFTYEIEIQKALEVAKENVIYGYSFRKQKAKLIFSLLALICLIGIVLSVVPELRIFQLLVYIFWLVFSLMMVFIGEEMQIKALQNRTRKIYKKKEKLKHGVLINSEQIAYYKNDNSTMSFPLNSIRRITYRSDLGGLFFSKSRIARFVYFVDLSSLEETARLEVLNTILNNLEDVDAQKELRESISKE